jgi:hypothetical protein
MPIFNPHQEKNLSVSLSQPNLALFQYDNERGPDVCLKGRARRVDQAERIR